MRGLLINATIGAALCAAIAAPLQAQDAAATLRRGDILRVTAYDLPELSGEFLVGPDGTLVHPLYRNVFVVGLPRDSVEARVGWVLQRFETTPRFVVEPLLHLLIGGNVGQPGFHNVAPGTTVRQGVLIAGGMLEDGRGDAVRLIRAGTSTKLNLDQAGGVSLASGDEVIVPAVKSGNWFRDVVGPLAALTSMVVSIYNISTR